MLRIATKTSLTPEQAIEKAVIFFGPDGEGLEIKDQQSLCASFEGAGGMINITACAEEKGASLELITQEWEHLVRKFIGKLDL